jgi:hypothetical protein
LPTLQHGQLADKHVLLLLRAEAYDDRAEYVSDAAARTDCDYIGAEEMTRAEQIQRVMVLADEYAEGFLAAPTGAVAQMRAALLAEVTELADWGEPVAWEYVDSHGRRRYQETKPTMIGGSKAYPLFYARKP